MCILLTIDNIKDQIRDGNRNDRKNCARSSVTPDEVFDRHEQRRRFRRVCIHMYTALYKFSFLRNFTCEFPVVNEKNYTFCRFVYPCRGYNDFSQSNAVRRFRLHKVHIFLISIARRDDLALSVCRLSVSFYANQSLCFKAIGLKLSQKSSFFCRSEPAGSDLYIL